MARSARALFVVCLLLLGALAGAAVPKVLLYQLRVKEAKEGVDLNVAITDTLAQEIDQAGKLTPICWGITDPVFRAAAVDGKFASLGELPDVPNRDQALAVAHVLDADFVLECESRMDSGQVRATVKLLKSGREVWKSTESIKVAIGGKPIDKIASAQSVARTLILRLNTEYFRTAQTEAKLPTADPTPGQTPVEVPVAPAPRVDDTKWRTDYQALLSDGKTAQAVLVLRDAIDANPLDAERRRALIRVLSMMDPIAAAEEARRAVAVAPDSVELRVEAARAWLKAGRESEARIDLNEAVARVPESPETLALLAELSVRQGDAVRGLELCDKTLKLGPNPEILLMRALCRSLLGGTDGVKQDFAALEKAAPTWSSELAMDHYRMATSVLDAQFDQMANDCRSLTQRIAVRPKDKEAADLLEQMSTLAEARDAFLNRITVPEIARVGNARRLLALKLMRQTLGDLEAAVSGTPDSVADARIDLGEAIRQMKSAREAWDPRADVATARP